MPDMQNAGTFIPDSGAATTPPPKDRTTLSGGFSDVVMLIAIVLLVSSLAVSTGVFLYSQLINKQIETKQASLNRVRNAIDKNTVESLKLLSKRLTVGNDILNKHNAVSEIFRALEQITLKSVQFTEFKFQQAPPDTLQLHLKGKALTVNAVAAQSKAFAANPDKFQNTIFSDLGFEKDGTVSFQVVTDINPDFINFVNLVLRKVNEGASQPYVNNSVNSGYTGNGNNNIFNAQNQAYEFNNSVQNDTRLQDSNEQDVQTDEFGIPINN